MTYDRCEILELKDRGPYGRSTFDQFASQSPKLDNESMSTPTREEIDAKLERTEARVDARLSQFNQAMVELMSKIQVDVGTIRGDIANAQQGMAKDLAAIRGVAADEKIALTNSLQAVKDELLPLKAAADKTKDLAGALEKLKASSWKNTWGAAGAIVLALVGIIAGMYSLGFTAFESGRNTAVVVRDAQQKIDEAASALKLQQEQSSAALRKQQEESHALIQEALKAINQARDQKQ